MGTTTAAAAVAVAAGGGLPAEENEAGVEGGAKGGVGRGRTGSRAIEGEERQEAAVTGGVRLRTSSVEDGLERTDGVVAAGALVGDGAVEGLGGVVVGARVEMAGGKEVPGVGSILKR